MKKSLIILFTLVILPVFLFAQYEPSELIEAPAETVGMSTPRLQMIDDHIKNYVENGLMPGGVFLVARKGKIVYNKSFGYRDGAKSQLYQNDDIFRIASMTKAVTTVSIMQLYEQGKLGLDDPIHHYIPGFKNPKVLVLDSFNEADSSYSTVKADRQITVRHLLTHSSGITYGPNNPGAIVAVYGKHMMNNVGLSHAEWTTEEMITRLAKVPLVFQPGSQYRYGLNMEVLGRIIEVVSGKSLSEYFQQNIFTPLGMVDTYFYLPKDRHDRLVPVFSYNDKGEIIQATDETLNYPLASGLNHYAGGGGLSSTAKDYALFIQALVNDGRYNGYRLLGRKTLEVMTSDQMIALNTKGKGYSKRPGKTYSLGFALTTEDGNGINSKSPGTYEWGGYFNTKFYIDPAEDLIFVGMTQIVPFHRGEFWERVYAMVYSAIED